jgi:hypothetical protein
LRTHGCHSTAAGKKFDSSALASESENYAALGERERGGAGGGRGAERGREREREREGGRVME